MKNKFSQIAIIFLLASIAIIGFFFGLIVAPLEFIMLRLVDLKIFISKYITKQ